MNVQYVFIKAYLSTNNLWYPLSNTFVLTYVFLIL